MKASSKIMLFLGCVISSFQANAADPQLVIEHQDSGPFVSKMSEVSRITFGNDGITVSAANEKSFSYNGIGKIIFDHEGTYSVSGITRVAIGTSPRLSVSPSAARSSITLAGYAGESTGVEIYSISGALVASVKEYKGESIDVSGLASGIYIVKTNVSTAKFVKL